MMTFELRFRRVGRRALVKCVLLLGALALLLPLAATAAPVTMGESPARVCRTFRVRPQDQVWAVSTRCLGCPGHHVHDQPWTVWKYDPVVPRWLTATTAEFYAADAADVVTPIYVHGNQIDGSLALSDGLAIYFQLAGKFDDVPPVRFVIWSWPSDKIRGPLRDVRAKAARSDLEAVYLGRFLAGMQPQVKVGLLGYSYGARIVAGGLHLMGGGQLLGWSVAAGERLQMRVALWAAAEHDDWLLPGRFHGLALGMADRWLITHNYCDPVLRRYRFIEKCGNPEAMGYSGVYGRNLLPAHLDACIEELNVTNLAGGTHDFEPYLYSSAIIDRTRDVVLWH